MMVMRIVIVHTAPQHQKYTFRREPSGILELCVLDLLEQGHHRVLVEWQVARQQYEEDHAYAPHVG
jgi:hypothetical protein